MSILIKGLDIPNSGQVEIVIRPHGKVFSKTLGIGKLEAIQISTPHGRLIDGDELRKSHCVECMYYPNECKKDDCDSDSIYHIDYIAKTILEAEALK